MSVVKRPAEQSTGNGPASNGRNHRRRAELTVAVSQWLTISALDVEAKPACYHGGGGGGGGGGT